MNIFNFLPFKRVKEISSTQAADLLAAGNAPQILDVRTAAEFAEGHIPGAKNIDVMSSSFEQKVGQLAKDKPYLVICKAGSRSAAACRTMSGMGFDVTNIAGGMMSWRGQVKRG